MLVVTGRHRPHEVLFLGFSALVGAAFIVGAKPPGTLESLMQTWVLWVWYLLLAASGTIGLVSFALADPYRALVLERAAMIGQATAPVVYAVALIAAGQARALFAAAFVLTWSVASAWRWWQIHRAILAIRSVGDRP